MAFNERDETPEFVVIHFFRVPGGELRCRATDARTRASWIVDDANGLSARLCGRSENSRLVLRYSDDRDDRDDERREHEERADVEEDSAVLHGPGTTSNGR
jgi:hypothetical protein